jgi:GH15 family glucan-1,4-alpha-glucosidase
MTVRFDPRFDYARQQTVCRPRRSGVLTTDRRKDVATIAASPGIAWQCTDQGALARFTPAEGETIWFVLTFDEDEVQPVEAHEPEKVLDATIRWWDAWAASLRYEGAFWKEVERSALALKLCCYEPTGAIVAAPTTSLPESYRGGRNWDYRFAWLRDSAFVLFALDVLGVDQEADAFLHFLRRVCRLESDDPLQIMFAVDSARELPEKVLEHLRGWRGYGPVRIGNGAVGQFQLDVYGEVVATAAQWLRRRELSEGLWKVLADLVNWTAVHWRDPDQSIWEPRHGARHHVFSKVMSWVALDRGAQIAARAGHEDEAQRWRSEADLVKAEVLERGWDPERRTFVQCYGEPQLDAALLVIPKFGFLPRTDPRVRSTVEAIRRELGSKAEDLIYRYKSADGLEGEEGAFVICGFWLCQALAMMGDVDEAERLFRNQLRRANQLGLLAEEIDPDNGEQLGNFPQGLSHAGLINTAHVIDMMKAGRPELALS